MHWSVLYALILCRFQLLCLNVFIDGVFILVTCGRLGSLRQISCKDCILTHIATCEEKHQEPNCFACGRGPIRANELLEVVRKEPTNSQPFTRILLRRNDFQSSTKLEALLRHLRVYQIWTLLFVELIAPTREIERGGHSLPCCCFLSIHRFHGFDTDSSPARRL